MSEKKYYVNLRSREISQIAFQNNNDFTIHATEAEVAQLRRKLNEINRAELDSYWRAHVPIIPYHMDSANDRHDQALLEAFQMVYNLGDKDAKDFVAESGLLTHLSITDD